VLLLAFAGGVAVALAAVAATRWMRQRRAFGTPAQRATHEALHRVALAAPHLRRGLTTEAAAASAGHLRALLGTPAVSVVDQEQLLAWDGQGEHHATEARRLAAEVLATGRSAVARVGRAGSTGCGDTCEVRAALLAPLLVEDRVVGALAAYTPSATASLVRAVGEVARWVSSQLELAVLDESRAHLAEARVEALRAQISPHFVYNALTAIASFVRTDPPRARELLLEFADFTRYSSRTHGEFTTLAEELRSIDRYLLLERARFGDRLQVTLQVAPEVLAVAVPYLCLQPLVENAVKHGLEEGTGSAHVRVLAEDGGAECLITVEDDGAGAEPERVRRALSGAATQTSIGLGNVDARLRATYGDDHGLVVETAPGAGTKVTLHVPKFATGVRAS
jgi:two-component system LytT family sensor kinase